MSALIELIVKLLGYIFSATLERRDQREKETQHESNITEVRAALAEAPADACSPALVAVLTDQHDRVQQALRDSGFQGAGVPAEGNGGPASHGSGAAPQSAPVLPRKPTETLIARLKKEELFSAKPYWDISQWTYGYGCEAPSEHSTITEPAAAALLIKRAQQSVDEFFLLFKGHEHKFNEVRQECFIDMLYNMGLGNSQKGMRSFVNTLAHITDYADPDWSRVSYNLEQSKWYKQVGTRAVRICKEVKTGVYA